MMNFIASLKIIWLFVSPEQLKKMEILGSCTRPFNLSLKIGRFIAPPLYFINV
jgi:hypothetical protein